jgi:hypothetical protein
MTIGKLIEAVEAGDGDAVRDISRAIACAARDSGEFFLWYDLLKGYHNGYNALDSAKAVHDVLLPGVRVEIFGPVDGEWGVTLPGIDTVFGPDLARAWLLAILTAKQAEGRG